MILNVSVGQRQAPAVRVNQPPAMHASCFFRLRTALLMAVGMAAVAPGAPAQAPARHAHHAPQAVARIAPDPQIVAALNAQEAGWSIAAQHYDQRLADVRAEFERQLAVADRRATSAENQCLQADAVDRMCSALRLIDHYGCTNNTSGRCWDGGRTREAQYSDDAWCNACIAAHALNGPDAVVNP